MNDKTEEKKTLTRKDLTAIPVQGLGKVMMEIQAIDDALEYAETDEEREDLEKRMETLRGEREVFAPAMAVQITNMETFAKSAEELIKNRLAYLKGLERRALKYKAILSKAMAPGDKFANEWVTVSMRKRPPRVEIPKNMHPDELGRAGFPDMVRKEIREEISFDKTALKDYIKLNGDEKLPDGIRLIEDDYQASIKVK